ncbi:hypothetical protein GCM10010862_08360 [Devosia nitrariae]|uniref:Uncharacterized protein n=2 Tax=Devosia nitrariae TaxID=2071872 RepID=A0ABQ5W0S1_9HYPH|nr:hypothetical protein GCM10010862_08360 [Devosia nitrariae]
MIRAIRFGSDEITADMRLEFARAALVYWESFDSRIPRNSPSDSEWIKGELDTTDTQRIGRAINTPQYALSQLSARSESCVGSHRLLVDNIGGDMALELYLWLKVSYCYDGENIQSHLQRAGLSNGRADGSFNTQGVTMARDYITGKIANSVYQVD